ncbi:glycoside hydrolase family 97 protein [Bacteroides sp.]|uniref:glycoside hydrolase family 97 protein n=1 Tax=Bacteroides sp. TaxID=29523 RepID=UPI0026075D27|nr:glycoside hydrolase family 97 protein [Bacteroides sp.]MDD3038486.1 glycoside hydrolase family 97 protein [Bacteroides sp.]
MTKKTVILFFLVLHSITGWSQKVMQLTSPNGQIVLQATTGDELLISVSQNGRTLLEPSPIGMNIREIGEIGKQPKVTKVTKRSVSGQKIASPIYKKSEVEESFNELIVQFKGKYAVNFRCYDQGVAYQFQTNFGKTPITVINEKADYKFPDQSKGYAAYSNRGKDGDIDSQFLNSFENTYDYKSLSSLNDQRLVILPFLVELPANNQKICITESDLYDYPGMFLRSKANTSAMEGVYATVPKVTEQGGHNMLQKMVKEREGYIARTKGTRSFPWRIFAIADNDKDLLDNDLVFLLGRPSSMTDLSWIKPGKVAWDWWNNWNLKGVDFRAGVNNDTYKFYIDFAAENNIEYVILDEGWAVNKKADMLQIIPQINLEELAAYAKSKKVDLILWAGYWAFHRDMEKVVKHYANMGIKGFKVDFMDRDDQEMVDFMWEAAEVCAEHKMLLDYHGTCKPFGLQRTYPNVINFEGVNGLEQLKWKKQGYDQVIYDLTFPFIRMLAGPVDYTQGAMRNATQKGYVPNYTEPMSQGTRCRQLAEYVIFESPFNMLCDTPINYINEEESTEFITSIPTVWDETVALDSKIGQYISMARRSKDTWYVGAINDWKTREMEIDLSFLPDGNYQIEIFRDGINADRNATDYKKEKKMLSDDKKVKIKMYPGGGVAAKISK